jgi:hypothetical protein
MADVTVAQTGLGITSLIGGPPTSTGGATVALTGQSLSVSAGIAVATTVGLTGLVLTSSFGSPSESVQLTGQVLNVSLGVVTATPGISVALTGKVLTSSFSSTTETGTANVIPTGQPLTSSFGSLIAKGNDDLVNLSGIPLSVGYGPISVSNFQLRVSFAKQATIRTNVGTVNVSVGLNGRALASSFQTTAEPGVTTLVGLTGQVITSSFGRPTVHVH